MSALASISPGDRFGKWTVLTSPLVPIGGHHSYVDAVCDCGTKRAVVARDLSRGRSKSCGCTHAVSNIGGHYNKSESGAWLGKAWHPDSEGYMIVSMPTPTGHTLLRQNVLVMEQRLGRALRKGETAHHKNGVRDDNRDSNLELWVTAQPKGQRPADLLDWAYEIIELYGKDFSDASVR